MGDLLPFCLGVVWLCSIAWVRDDARRRIRNGRAVMVATAGAAVLPIAGAGVWALVRPPETLEERRCRRLARLLAELEAGPEPAEGGDATGLLRQRRARTLAVAR
jgi:hypothetical protein